MIALVESKIRGMREARGPLPSVRELAADCGASPGTVHKALRRLAGEGTVHSLPRKGYFWGSEIEGEHGASNQRESADTRLLEKFLSDLRHGVHHPWKELPSRKALAQIYGVGDRRMGRALDGLTRRGTLERRGRGFFLASSPRRSTRTSVIVVVRCDGDGHLLLDTEREIDFMKSVRREFEDQGLALYRVGYCEARGGLFLDGRGNGIDPGRLPGTFLGVLVSTWLVSDPQALLHRLARTKLPLSVWWEHPADSFPKTRLCRDAMGFNLSFGTASGIAVGRHLSELGSREVAFVSPFHGSEWSQARLTGLREGLEPHGGKVVEFVDSRCESPWQLRNMSGGETAMRLSLRERLGRFWEDPRWRTIQTFVAVNDLVAVELFAIFREHRQPSPRLVGFDNSSDSERLGFDSFEFHTDGMVRQMLHHVAHPRASLFEGPRVHEMIGRLVVRTGLIRYPGPSRSLPGAETGSGRE